MAKQYEACLESIILEVDGLTAGEVPEELVAKLKDAGGEEEAGQNIFECQVPGCSMEMRTEVIAGRITLMSRDVLARQQPCEAI
jgi:hypothetical protein